MSPRVVKKNAATPAQKKTVVKAPSKSPKTPAKLVSSIPEKPEPEVIEKAESKPSPTIEAPKAEEKVVKPFQDLNEPSIEAETEKEIPIEYDYKEIKESVKDSDKPSTEGTEEVLKGVDLENKETYAVMQEAPDNEGKDKERDDEPAETNVVVGEQSHGDDDGAGYHEEGVERDGADEQHDVEMSALAKERIKQKEFEVFVVGLDKDADEEDLKRINDTNTSPGRSMVLQLSTGNASASQLLASVGNSPRGAAVMTRSPSTGGSCNGGDGGMLPLPLSLVQGGKSGDMDEHRSREDIDAFKSANNTRDSNLGGLFPSFNESSRGVRQPGENFHSQTGQVTMQGYGGMPQPQHQNPPPTGVGAAPPARHNLITN